MAASNQHDFESDCRSFVATRDAYFKACETQDDEKIAAALGAMRLVRATMRERYSGFTDSEALAVAGRL